MARKKRSRYVFAEDRSPHRVRRFFSGLLLILLALALLTAAFNFAVTHEAVLETQRVTVPNLPADLEQFSILHLSDLHGAVYGSGQAAIRTLLKDQRLSCCVITGDMLGEDADPGPLLEIVGFLAPDLVKVYLPGDEDPPYLATTAQAGLSPLTPWAEKLQAAGVILLDRPVLITRGRKDEARLWLIPEELYTLDLGALERTWQGYLDSLTGLDGLTADQAAVKRASEYQLLRVAEIRESLAQMKETDIQVVVSHAPVSEDYARTLLGWSSREDLFSIRQASLVLAGHFCGGQWRLPWGGAVYVEDFGWFPEDRLITGFSYVSGIPQYISPGLGANHVTSWQPFRLFVHPVVTKVVLTAHAQP